MSVNLTTTFPTKSNTADPSGFPFGQPQNVTIFGDGTGTPWDEILVKDDYGYKSALLTEAGLVPSNTPDNATKSQYLEAAKNLHGVVVDTPSDLLLQPTTLPIGTKGFTTTAGKEGNWVVVAWTSEVDNEGDTKVDSSWESAGKYWRRDVKGAAIASWFGVVGDGVVDDTVTMQAFLDTSYKYLVFNSGHNNLISSPLTTSVADRVLVGFGVTISPTTGLSGVEYCINNTSSRVKVLGFKFAGVASVTLCGGFGTSTGDSVEVLYNSFIDLDNGGGIVATSAGVGHNFSNNFFSNVAPVALGGAQFGAIHCNGTKSVISNNRVIACPQTGISTINPIGIIINNNYIDGANVAASGGIILDAAGNSCVLSGNVIKDVRVEGIQISNGVAGQASEDHNISNNTITSTRAANDGPVSGITVIASGTGTTERININGNSIRSDDRDATSSVKGIDLDGCIDTNISGNLIEGGWVGIGYTGTSVGTNITGNTLRNQNTTGISATSGGRECLIQGNKIIGDGTAGSTTAIVFNAGVGGGEQLITGNYINDCLVGVTGTFSGSQRSFIHNNFFLRNGTDLNLTSSTTNSIRDNCYNVARSGEATLVAGTVTVNTTAIKASDRIELSVKTSTGNEGALYVDSRTNGAGFVVSSTNVSDTSVIYWELNG